MDTCGLFHLDLHQSRSSSWAVATKAMCASPTCRSRAGETQVKYLSISEIWKIRVLQCCQLAKGQGEVYRIFMFFSEFYEMYVSHTPLPEKDKIDKKPPQVWLRSWIYSFWGHSWCIWCWGYQIARGEWDKMWWNPQPKYEMDRSTWGPLARLMQVDHTISGCGPPTEGDM